MSRDFDDEVIDVDPVDDDPGTDLAVVDDEWVEDDEPVRTAEEIAADIAAAMADMTRLTVEAQQTAVAPVDDSTALVPSNLSVKQAKVRLAKVRADVTRQQNALRDKQEIIRQKHDEIENLMREQMALASEALGPLRKIVERLNEGIWTVNLYLGRDEEILTLYDGEPAAEDEIVVIRQLVLAMDEESALNPDEDGIDATNIEEFDGWLQADWAHVEQIAPEPRCVVALRPRFKGKHYEDAWKQNAVDEANKQTYFLIRNGGTVYRTWTEFNVGQRLVPNADEFSGFFYEDETRWGNHRRGTPMKVPITPGTLAWERAEEAADARRRHFMRVAMILQGLVDRTTVFHPNAGINFGDFEQNGKTWRFLMDGEMSIATGRQPFYEWLAEKNSHLTVGMRVVGTFERTYTGSDDRMADRIYPRGAERPPTGELLAIEEKSRDGSFVVRYKRTEKIYDPRLWVESKTRPGYGHYGGYKEPKNRASFTFTADDRFIIPFDLVTEDEMRGYLGARLDRHAYVTMFPLLKAAIRAKQAEREQEAPFRTMLAGVLARENGVEVADAEVEVPALVDWFKLANKHHRPLVGSEKEQAHAVRLIVDEHGRRLNAKAVDDTVVARILRRAPDAILIGRKREGKYVALIPENGDNVFVCEAEFGARGNPSGEPKRWRLMPSTARRAKWLIAFQSPRLDEWDFAATLDKHLTGPEFDRLNAAVLADAGGKAVAVAYDPKDREWHTWRLVADAVLDAEHPISGVHSKVKVERVERKWRRKGGVVTLGAERTSHRSGWVDQRKPWDTRTKDGGPSDWRRTDRNLYEVVFHNAKLDAHVEAEKHRYREFGKVESRMRERVRGYANGIETAWVKRKEAVEFDKFVEEYLDPSLWEGHRKQMGRDAFAYPHSHRVDYRSIPDAFYMLIEYAVESGVDLGGLTVWKAAEQHMPPTEWQQRRAKLTGDMWHQRDFTLRTADDIQEDLRYLTFPVLDEPEPDDEDEDDDLIEEGVASFRPAD